VEEQKPLVLIADDEQNAVILLTRILQRDGFEVENARDGISALDKARKLRPDLILMDVQMPKLNGFEVVERLREDPATARIPIIFVTAAAREPSDVAHGFKLGADDYIRKPYNYHELLARAHSKMRARQLEDRLQRRSEELEALVRIGGEFNQRLGLGDLTELILIVAGQESGADYAELYLFDDNQGLLLYRNTAQHQRTPAEAGETLRRAESPAGRVFHTGEPVLISHLDENQRNSSNGLAHYPAAAAAPLKHHGKLVGILVIAGAAPDQFSENDLRLLRSIGEQAALAVRNAQLYAELQSYAQNLEDMVEVRTEELRATQAELVRTEKLAALGRLAAGIAHEVNNPLQPILNCLEVTLEDIESGAQVDSEVLRVAEREVQRIKTIVTRLLDFARPNTTDMVEVDLRELIDEVLVLSAKQLERMRVRVHKKLAQTPLLIGNPTQLKQVMLNLVLNAMEAMPEGGDLTIDLRDSNRDAEITIMDTGIGMDSQTVARIFEPFYSTKGEGTGLGLAVTYGIIEGHGGTIQVDSEPGKGSRFTIWLPYSR
jgi:signal transduction histidine kinase/FixJ family two-component response regulator